MKQLNNFIIALLLALTACQSIYAQFVHPGLSHKKSDLDRMRSMVAAKIDPWYSSYQDLTTIGTASFNYAVQGDITKTEVYRDAPGTNKRIFEDDSRAAYYNALRWYIEGDERYAKKAVECLNAWSGLTYIQHNGTTALTSNMVIILLEAAELIKNTYDGWEEADIQRFKDMLLYPGYSNTTIPPNESEQGTWYWRAQKFDPVRAGNQELCSIRTTMAIGVFLDDERIYDRAWRYINQIPGREDDIAFPKGPHLQTEEIDANQYRIAYSIEVLDTEPNFYGNGALTNYVYENGQCQESSRDQGHTVFGLGVLVSIGEIAWNQGDDLWGNIDSRILLGLEYTLRYNVSFVESFPDQLESWEPTVESGEFLQRDDATRRSFALSICPVIDNCETCLTRGKFFNEDTWELPIAHYVGRGLKTPEEAKWTIRARDYSIKKNGRFETGPTGGAYVGFGGLSFRRPEGCYGDPISGFETNGQPIFEMNTLPLTIEAENFDFFVLSGEGRTHHDTSEGNTNNEYRTDENVDIAVCSEGGYKVTNIDTGEWLNYSISVPVDATYDITVRYAATAANGTVKLNIGGTDITSDLSLPVTGEDNWQTFTVTQDLELTQGVQPLKLIFNGAANVFELNNIDVTLKSIACREAVTTNDEVVSGINYKYYEGEWDVLPNFELLNPIDIGLVSTIDLGPAIQTENFGLTFEGYFNNTTEGDYTFYLNSDGGSRLTIDGLEIVNNDGIHELIEESGVICLDAGNHQIKVEYFEKTNGSTLSLMYEGPNISKTMVTDFFAGIILKTIPGQIEAEEFTANAGLEIENTSDVGGGGQIGFVNPGDYLTYDTTVSEAGIYKFGFRASSATNGGYVTVKVGDNSLGTVNISSTGGWNNWETFYLPNILLKEGFQNVRLEFSGDPGFLFNLNWFSAEQSIYEIPSRLEAEQYNSQSGITTESTTDMNGNLQITDIDANDTISFNVNVPEASTYQLGYRVASEITGNSISIKSNGNVLSEVTIPSTGSLNTWQTINSLVQLDSGLQTLELEFTGETSNSFDLNWIEFSALPELPGVLEAEDYAAQSGIAVQSTSDLDGDYQVESINNNDYISFYTNVTKTDTYRVGFRVASEVEGGSVIIKSDDNIIGEINIPNTGSYTTWKTEVTELDLVTGIQNITFEFRGDSGNLFHLNWIEFSDLPELPGILEAEDYSSQSGVETQQTTDSDEGENVTLIENADYITFNVRVLESDVYQSSFRVASEIEEGSIIVKNNDTILSQVDIPNTGGLNRWETISILTNLEAGKQTLTFEFVGYTGQLFNLNWIEFSELPVIPGRLEAEDYLSQSGIQTEASSDSGGGENIGFTHAGDFISFQTKVSTSGVYNISYRASSATEGGSVALKNNDIVLNEVILPGTDSWDRWETQTAQVELQEGEQTLEFEFLGGEGFLFNINWIEFELTDQITLSSETIENGPGSEIKIYPNPVNNLLTITNNKGGKLEFYDITGKLILAKDIQNDNESINMENFANQLYIIKIKNEGFSTYRRVIKQ